MYESLRPVVELSHSAWGFLDEIKTISYGLTLAQFVTTNAAYLREGIRAKHPDFQGDLLRAEVCGAQVTVSIEAAHLQAFAEELERFYAFGAAVRMLGAYEHCILRIVDAADQAMPTKMASFRTAAKTRWGSFNPDNRQHYFHHNLGRGLDVLTDVFSFGPHASYRPCMQFFVGLRNVCVHCSGIADKHLEDAALSPHVHVVPPPKVGSSVSWNFSSALKLQHLLLSIVTDSDPSTRGPLSLATDTRQAWWYDVPSEGAAPSASGPGT